MLTILAAMILGVQGSIAHTFEYRAGRDLDSVSLAGTFNNWDKGATPMVRDGRNWSKRLRLSPGKHLYKFVLNGEEWITDPAGAKKEDDGNGNINSVLLLLPPDYKTPGRRGDGEIAASALFHQPKIPTLNFDRGRLTFTLRARPNDVQTVELLVEGQPTAMRVQGADEFYARYSAQFEWDGKRTVRYSFRLRDGARVLHFGPSGATASAKGNAFELTSKTFKPFAVPGWVERSVIYQIFPDRFANGTKANDPSDVMPWGGEPTYANRFGGDFAGVRSKIDYLGELGVGAIYFNPVFASPSNHRYEATDYLRVDPQLGTNAEFATLTRELKAKGIRTVLDGVFNHTAVDHAAFLDLRAKGAESKYRDWFFPKSFPIEVKENPNYVAWFGFPSMPKVNLLNPAASAHMLAVPAYWHKHAAIAGWRLDVANEVPMEFWRRFRDVVKGLDSDNWIVGEVWGDGSPWLEGDQWDSVMNYQFREASLGFFANQSTTAAQFLDRLMAVYLSYAPQVSRNMMNLLGSHDTPRFLTLCGGDASRARLGALVQFTWVGAPCVYYGDELGMEGKKDPDNRRGMRWDLATRGNSMLRWYQALSRLRTGSRALQSGDPVRLVADDAQETLAFARVLDRDVAIVALNRSPYESKLSIPVAGLPASATYVDSLTGRTYTTSPSQSVLVTLGARSGVVLLPATAASVRLASQLSDILSSKESS